MLCKNWNLLGEEKSSSHAHKTGSWYLLEVLFKISDEQPRPLIRTPTKNIVRESVLRHVKTAESSDLFP